MTRLRILVEDVALRAGAAWHRLAGLRAAVAAQLGRTRRHPLAWGTVYVALICLLAMAIVDRPLAWWFHRHLSGNWEGFFRIVTNLGRAEFYLIPAGLLWLGFTVAARRTLFPEQRRRWRALAWKPGFLFLAMALSGVAGTLIKIAVGRARPRVLFENGSYGLHPFVHDWSLNSFPSGHSQAAWAAMMALVVLVPRYNALWLLVATLVAVSRVALSVHFLSDAMGGSWLGAALTLALARYLRGQNKL